MTPKRMANLPKVPWITADGALDPAKLPIDSVLQQCVQGDPDKLRSGCRTLSMMAYYGRVDAAVFLLGLLRYYEDEWSILEAVVEGLSSFRDPRCAAALFGELRRVKSSNTTRRYLGVVIRTLTQFPREMVRERFLDLAEDPAYTYRMRAKFSAAAEGVVGYW